MKLSEMLSRLEKGGFVWQCTVEHYLDNEEKTYMWKDVIHPTDFTSDLEYYMDHIVEDCHFVPKHNTFVVIVHEMHEED